MDIAKFLKKYSSTEIELLLAHVLRKTKEFVFLHPEHRLSAYQLKRLFALSARLKKGEPMAYILGYKDFYGLRFKVNKNVLIPRPETEWLVEKVVAKAEGLGPSGKVVKILDVGTGSGAIAIALSQTLKNSTNYTYVKSIEFYGSDVSKKALEMAKENARLLLPLHPHPTLSRPGRGKRPVRVRFIQSDLFKNIKGKFTVIVANLPYIPASQLPLLFKEGWLQSSRGGKPWEPIKALTEGTNEFEIYERFLREVADHIEPYGYIYLEMDPKTKPFIAKWAKKYLPKSKLTFYKDFSGLWRYAEIVVG